MSSKAQADVRSHFGLRVLPFTREIPVDKLYPHPQFKEAVRALHATVEERMSAAIIGAAGTGKTVVLRALKAALPEARYRVHYVKLTNLCVRDFCKELAVAMGCTPAGHFGALVRKVQDRAQTLMEQESLRPVIILDEAHDMRPEVLAILRVLTNFEMDSRLVVSIILAGQPSLKHILRREELESVTRRLAHYATLRLLSREENRDYVAHRLNIAGTDHALFDNSALDALYEMTQGNLRATDRVALKAMEQAFGKDDPVVGFEHVAAAKPQVTP